MWVLRTLSFLIFTMVFMGRAQEPPVLPPTQEIPKLPDLNPPVPMAPAPPRLTADRCSKVKGRCPHRYHFECGPQAMACVPDCPKGYHAASSSRDVCTTPKNPCVTIFPVFPIMRSHASGWGKNHGFGWQASLCNAKLVVVSTVDPVYPEKTAQAKRQGIVDMSVHGFEDGTIETFALGDFSLKEAAQAALKQWHWKPFLLHGRPIEFRIKVYFAFELTARGPQVRTLFECPTSATALICN
jgi:hypothetical protein